MPVTSGRWEMGFFVFDLFSLMSSAACSLIGVFVNCGVPWLFTFMQLWEQVSPPEQPGLPVLLGLPRIPQTFSALLGWAVFA